MADLVQLLNEDGYLADGEPYESVWTSQSLNRRDLGRLYTLPHVELNYSAVVATTVEVSASPDGGVTFPVVQTVALAATGQDPEQVGKVSVAMRITGMDLRLRVRFNNVLVSNVSVFVPPLIERGKHHYAVRATESDT